MLYSAGLPAAIASARLAMLPPVEFRPGCQDVPMTDRPPRRRVEAHLCCRGYSRLLNPPCDSRYGMRARSSAVEGLWNAPFIYASARVVKNDLFLPPVTVGALRSGRHGTWSGWSIEWQT